MAFNEEETRFHLIDPVLRRKGYDDPQRIRLETPAPVEPTGPKGRRRKGAGRTDYLLCVQVGDMPKPLPVAVLEAKRSDADPLKGMEQAKGYADCTRFDVQYVFASNGHLYGDYDKPSGIQTGPHPLADFPPHPDLCARYAKDKSINLASPDAALLFQADSPAWSATRYYQDAAIRAAFEKIILERQAGNAPRVLLTLATGAGKTIIATNLLWRMAQAGLLPKPALFLCDRDELREQAYTKLKAAFGGNVRIVQTERGQNAAANARIHIATYQTLGIDENGDGSFLTDHYGEDAFSVIIIDECHRSAWGKWSQVLTRNPNAIHIGLTATPRKLKPPKNEKKSKDVEAAIAEDEAITAHNVQYFGEPVYEYSLAQAQEDGYLAACEIVKRKADIDARIFTREEILKAGVKDIRTGKPLAEEDLTKTEYTGKDFDDELFIDLRTPRMCEDLFKLLCENGGPEQKVIIFCTRDLHADRVAMQMNNLYAAWCNLRDILDRVHEISIDHIDDQHFFTLSQVYEDLLLKMGEKNSDGGQFFTPREVIRAMVHTVNPSLGQTVYDPCCGTGGFLAVAYEHIARKLGNAPVATDIEKLKHDTFFGREKENLVFPIALANLVLHGIDQPNLWHGNSLTRRATYAALFQHAPAQFDVILTNPPFGGKEGKDAQKNFAFETSATQVLFVQDILSELAPGGTCAIVLDEGLLFRTNESAFVETKRKLLDECELWAVLSLPGGVFSTAGAGVKTNLLFFTKGRKTERIWYYDLSWVKVGKKTPLTLAHFGFGKDGAVLGDDALPAALLAEWQADETNAGQPFPSYARLLASRGDGRYSWTVDFATRRAKAREEMQPWQDKAAGIKAAVVDLIYQIQFWSNPGEDGDARHPIVIVCDEAHLYLPSSAASTGPMEKRALENYERIAKEGRKYGVGLMVVSQRPSDVSTTILSQCSNIISLRLANKTDQSVVKQLLPESLEGLMEVLPTLDVGEAVVVGDATLLPTRIKMSKPKHEPRSATIPFWARWAKPKAEVDLTAAVENMRRQSRDHEK